MKAYQTTTLHTLSDGSQLLDESGIVNVKATDIIHTIIQGETLLSISEKYYGNHEEWVTIYLANDMLDPFDLTPGQTLVIPQ